MYRSFAFAWNSGFATITRSALRELGGRKPRHRRPRLESLESRCLLAAVAEFPVPLIGSGQPSPVAVTSASGKLWFTEEGNAIGMVDPANPSVMQSYSNGLIAGSTPRAITTGPDGNVWFTEITAGAVGVLNVSNPSSAIVNLGSAQGLPANTLLGGITTGPDGKGGKAIWFTDSAHNQLGMVTLTPNPASDTITMITVPNTLVGIAGFESQITAGPDGKLYFTEASAIGIYDPTAKVWSEVALASGEQPFGITVGPDNNIYFTEAKLASGGSGVQNPEIGELNLAASPPTRSDFPITPSGGATPEPYLITAGPDGRIWFTDPVNSAVDAIDPATHAFTAPLSIPKNNSSNSQPSPSGITAGPDGNVWFIDVSGAVGRVTLDTKLAITTQPPASVTTGSSFGLTAQVEYSDTNVVDMAYTGNVTIALTSPGSNVLGGTTTMPVTAGVASFTTLTLANPGTNFTLTATAGSLTSAPSAGINVTAITVPAPTPTPTPTPTSTKTVVIGEQPIFQRKLNKKGKPIGKAVLSVFALDFSVPLNAASASNTANYQVDTVTTMRVKRKIETILHPIKNFTVSYVAASDAIQIKLGATETFPTGGQITVLGGLTTASGSTLSGPAVFTVSKGGKSIGPS